jgi:hypothetical protein
VVPNEIAWNAHRYLKKQTIQYNHRDIEAQRKKGGTMTDAEESELTGLVIGAAEEVHRVLGPGLLINFNVPVLKDGIKRVAL